PVMATERVRRRGGAGDGGDPPPSGGLLGVAPLVQQDAEVVGGGAVARRGGGTQMGFGSVEITTAQQHGAEDTRRLDVAGLGGEPPAQLFRRLVGGPAVVRFLPRGGLHKTPCLEQSCPV